MFAIAILSFTLTSCVWTQVGGGPGHTGSVPSSITPAQIPALTRIWSQPLSSAFGNALEPVSDGQRLFLVEPGADGGSFGDLVPGKVVAFDLASGTRLWTADQADARRSASLAVADGLVIASGRLCVLAYAADTGVERWRQCVPEPPSGIQPDPPGVPTISDGLVYVAWRTEVVELRLQDGEYTDRSFHNPWDARVPTVGNGHLAMGTVFDLATGAQLWDDQSHAFRAIRDGVLYSANFDGEIAAYDLASGFERWRASLLCSGDAAPAIGGDAVYLNDCGTVRALDRNTGLELWHSAQFQYGSSAERPTLAGSLLYMTNSTTALTILDPATGDLVRSIQLGVTPGANLGAGPPVVVGRYVIVAGQYGLDVYAPA
jgi:outer membrane protein assembly factor BamB